MAVHLNFRQRRLKRRIGLDHFAQQRAHVRRREGQIRAHDAAVIKPVLNEVVHAFGGGLDAPHVIFRCGADWTALV